ncbi:MAG: MFS transporter [Acidimicrobiia bacterium]|nr:MFS transporter [Acidimicrobiia bacterium]
MSGDHDVIAETGRPPLPFGIKVLLSALFASSMANRSQLVALGLLVFDVTGREIDLGLLGLAEFLPIFIMAPFSGSVTDRFDRRLVYLLGLLVEIAAAALLFLYARNPAASIGPILALVVVFGLARSFVAPASRALPIDLAPKGAVERVVALRSVSFQVAGIVGPIVVGQLFRFGRSWPFLLSIAGFSVAALLLQLVPQSEVSRLTTPKGPRQAIRDAVDGLRFMRRSPVVFGAISLDLFAVLFGGAVALLPAIGEKRLGVDEAAVGMLYSAVGVGALITAMVLSVRPIRRHVGLSLFGAISVFGLATIALGLTTNYLIALVALMILSSADAVSVFVRATIVPLATPEEMRGRVLAVENIFIGGSNELGSLESGLTAGWFGLAPAVVIGGLGTLAVVVIWMRRFPELRRINRFEEVRAGPAH